MLTPPASESGILFHPRQEGVPDPPDMARGLSFQWDFQRAG